MRRALPIVLMLCGTVACPGTGRPGPDDTPEPSSAAESGPGLVEQPIPASLLRRLGEAVDGYRDGRPRFVVANRQFPHKVDRVFEDSLQASARAGALGGDAAGFGVFGPFRAVEDPPEVVDPGDVVDSVIVFTHDGVRKAFGADSVDALFWSLPAFDKFIGPYLTAVYGPRYAAEQREFYRTKDSRSLAKSQIIPHYRSSF